MSISVSFVVRTFWFKRFVKVCHAVILLSSFRGAAQTQLTHIQSVYTHCKLKSNENMRPKNLKCRNYMLCDSIQYGSGVRKYLKDLPFVSQKVRLTSRQQNKKYRAPSPFLTPSLLNNFHTAWQLIACPTYIYSASWYQPYFNFLVIYLWHTCPNVCFPRMMLTKHFIVTPLSGSVHIYVNYKAHHTLSLPSIC